ncbi:MAG: FtsX-like permease family protein, partial [Limisphaerales bacterium]
TPKAVVAPALLLPASAVRTDGLARVNQVNLLGVKESFWRLAPARPAFDAIQPGHVVLNRALARSLGITEAGAEVLIRTRSPSALALDSALSAREAGAVALRLRVQAVVEDGRLGAFSLRQSATPTANAFVRLEELAEAAGCPGRANLGPAGMLADALPVPENLVANANAELARAFTLADSESALEKVPQAEQLELRTPRVFLDPPVVQAALAADTNALPLLTYLANLITAGTNAAPYSMVTAAGAPWTPPGLRDDEIVLNQWLAEDLQAKPGDRVTLVYYDPESGARLTERTNTFRVHSIVPMEMPWADRTLMPPFPGIEKAETTADWDTAFPLVHPIRPQDDDYWTEWRGTPKAFVTLAAGQKMWANRFGDLTAIRFPVPTDQAGETFRAALEKKILATLKPEALGLRFEPVREQALKAAEQSQDFGGLFIGFSLFVIVAALLLMALLFQFSLEQRTAEIGTLLALGFMPNQVRRLFLREGAALALLGGVLGTLGGIGYARVMLHGLTTLWSDAVGGSALKFFVTPQTLVIGLLASTGVAVFTLWLALRKQARQPARALLVGEDAGWKMAGGEARRVRSTAIASGALIAAVGLVGWTLAKGDTTNAGAFFGAGALVLIAGLSFFNARLARRDPPSSLLHLPSTRTLALRGLARRRSRSVATAAMLASGAFLIVSIGVFRLDANRDATKRTSGTGGFALIGESTMPVVADLNTRAGREVFALEETDFADVNFVQFRVRAGDEASCLNLNRAQKPRLLGVNPDSLAGRFTFAKGAGWSALRGDPAHQPDLLARTDEVPAIGDAASIQWAMGKKVGDTLDYVDERGQPFRVRIVGAVANSILQGQLVIDEAEFVRRFPGESGYKFFLIDAPTNRVADVSARLSRALQDVGLELTPAPRRLAQFNAVQNTYLGTFQILGGLGLLLGSAGLGIVVLRNVLERRGELAVLLAVGWRRGAVNRLVLREHLALLGLGLALGLAAAVVAVLPAALTPGAEFPWLTLGLTLAAVLANGVAWTWLATRAALRGELLAALRNE